MRRSSCCSVPYIMCLGLLYFIAAVRAQEKGQEASKAEAPQVVAAEVDPVDKKLDSARVSVEFSESPLSDVCNYLADVLEIDVVLDRQSLDEMGVSGDNPVSLSITKSEVSARTVLEMCLRQVSPALVSQSKDGLLIITTEEKTYVTQVYNVAKLIDGDTKLDVSPAEQLRQVVVTTVQPGSWNEVGGQASAIVFKDKLIVKQSSQAHREIRELLQKIETANVPARR